MSSNPEINKMELEKSKLENEAKRIASEIVRHKTDISHKQTELDKMGTDLVALEVNYRKEIAGIEQYKHSIDEAKKRADNEEKEKKMHPGSTSASH